MKTKQVTLSLAELEQTFATCSAWEQRYRQLLLLAKQLSPLPESDKITANLIKGCESQVWLCLEQNQLRISSDAKIIRGLLVILLTCINESDDITAAQTLFNQRLQAWGLAQHLSASRNDGINAIWQHLAQV